VEKSRSRYQQLEAGNDDDDSTGTSRQGSNDWLEVAVEVPGLRDDDSMPIFLAAMTNSLH